jgi:flagellar biosynthesis/type III secretory pathway protein FliH
VILTNSLEIHFINMVKYRKARGKPDEPLNRWLAWFDRSSTPELIEEVVRMDDAIQTADEKLVYVTGDEDAQRAYLTRFRAMCDWTSAQNASHRKGFEEGHEQGVAEGLSQGHAEGVAEGLSQGREEVVKLFEQGLSIEEIKKRLGT